MDGQSSPPAWLSARSDPPHRSDPPPLTLPGRDAPTSELTSTSPKRSAMEMVLLLGGGANASRASHDGSVPRTEPGFGPLPAAAAAAAPGPRSKEFLLRSAPPPLASCSSRFAAAARSRVSASFRASSAAFCSRLLASLSACRCLAAVAIFSSSFLRFSASLAILNSFSRLNCSAAAAFAAFAAGPNFGVWSPACATCAALRRFLPSSLTTWIGCDLRTRPGHGLS